LQIFTVICEAFDPADIGVLFASHQAPDIISSPLYGFAGSQAPVARARRRYGNRHALPATRRGLSGRGRRAFHQLVCGVASGFRVDMKQRNGDFALFPRAVSLPLISECWFPSSSLGIRCGKLEPGNQSKEFLRKLPTAGVQAPKVGALGEACTPVAISRLQYITMNISLHLLSAAAWER